MQETWLEQAWQLFQTKQWSATIALCQKIIGRNPQASAAYYLLGNCYGHMGNWREAAANYNRCLALQPGMADCHYQLGLIYRRLGKIEESVTCLERVLQIQSQNVEALAVLGRTWAEQGNITAANVCYQQILTIHPQYVQSQFLEAQHSKHEGDLVKMRWHQLQAMSIQPTIATGAEHLELGNSFAREQNFTEAIGCYGRAVQIQPDLLEAYCHQGIALQRRSRHSEAIACYQMALHLAPDRIDIYLNLGVALKEVGNYGEAVSIYQQALQIDPNHGNVHSNLANLYLQYDQLPEAILAADRALSIDVNLAEAHDIKGAALQQLGHITEAIKCYRLAIGKNPQLVSAHFNLSHALLSLGEFEEGWREYEWRWHRGSLTMPSFSQPLWQGEYLAGKRILIWCEQGMGDTLQFIRYVWQVRELGGVVIVVCPQPLERLLGAVEGVSAVVSAGNNIPPFDVYVPSLSLPRLCATSIATIPDVVPYVEVPLPAPWQIPARDGLKVGIVWASSDQASLKMRSNKSCSIDRFLALATPDIHLYSLQVGSGAADIATIECDGVCDLSSFIDDFGDTAALIAQLDLVISVDTAVAHLAGALAKPVWVLLPWAADWRWLIDREDSPWYPTMRLFRQQDRGDWQGVFDRVQEALSIFGRDVDRYRSGWRSGEDAFNRGNWYFAQGNHQEAAKCYQEAIYRHYPAVNAYYNLGVVKRNSGYSQAAIVYFQYFQQALRGQPEAARTYLSLAKAHLDLEQLEEALQSVQKSLRIAPGVAEALHTLGLVYFRQGKNHEAIDFYQQALQQNPDDSLTHYNLAIALLLVGNYEVGWQEYEWRLSAQEAKIGFSQPKWQGENLSGQRILLWSEGGYGDTIQFLRYIPYVRSRGGKILLACQNPLVQLLSQMTEIERVIPMASKLTNQDFAVHLPLMSLPYILRLIDIPPPWQDHPFCNQPIANHPPRKIAIVWASGFRQTPNLQRLYRAKSCPIGLFMELQKIPHLQFYSFQVGKDAQDIIPYLSHRVIDWSDRLQDFTDTVTLLSEMDLVITVDTAIAHLSGTLGIPTWVLLHYAPDWRWHLDREDSPWYPTLKLFRQKAPGDWKSAIEAVMQALQALYQSVIAEAESDYSQGNAAYRQGQWQEAILAYQKVIAINPYFATAHFNLGVVLKKVGAVEEAIFYYKEALRLGLNSSPVHFALGNAYLSQNKLTEACTHYAATIAHQPDFAESYAFWGEALRRQKNPNGAIPLFQKAIELNPSLAEAYNNWGTTLIDIGREEEAIEKCQKAIELNPTYALAYSNLGVAQARLGNLAIAHKCYQTALQFGSPTAELWNNLGSLLRRQYQLEEALQCFRQAIILKSYLPELHINLGHALYESMQIAEAAQSYQKAISLDETQATAHFGLAYTHLISGDFTTGWQKLEWRWQHAGLTPLSFCQPPWQQQDICGQRLLVWGEQGFGDKIQFIRYLSLLQQSGIEVLYLCSPPLKRLCATIPGVQIIAEDGEIPDFDVHIPLMSLMRMMKTTIETIPKSIPYLFPKVLETEPIAHVSDRKIGIVWATGRHSSPMAKESHLHKSCPIALFLQLLTIPNIHLFSLQFGSESAVLQTYQKESRLIDLSPLIVDFYDTAILINQLDLVITVDTAVAHLAGALGKPVWVLLPYSPDWRWLLDRQDSPWYPTMRLFRQTIPGNWQHVIDRVKVALQE